jgi:gas vesicle protein
MLAVALVLIAGWLLGSIIGTCAYFAGAPETEVSPFKNYKKQIDQRFNQERQTGLQTNRTRQPQIATFKAFSSN